VIAGYDFKQFEQGQLILSKPRKSANGYVADKVLPVEGAVTYLHYEVDPSVSAFQLFRNHQSALRRSGFKELFVCERPCIADNLGELRQLMASRNLYLNGHEDIQYVAAQRGDTYVSMAVNSMGSSTDAWVFVIDKQALDDGRIGISGDSPIAKALAAQGKVDVYGFLFDTGKASLKKGSDATLGELAQVLKDNPTLSLELVGHTDNVGQASDNLQLSRDRAAAVGEALRTRHGVEASRLLASGRGDTQPVAANTTEEGRSRNRRVEVIAQAPAVTAAGPAVRAQGSTSSNNASTPASTAAGNAPPRTTGREKSTVEQVRDGANTVHDVARGINAVRGLFGF
jgi:outer membrane protein OmpA-like peptidoglycan-associated protein